MSYYYRFRCDQLISYDRLLRSSLNQLKEDRSGTINLKKLKQPYEVTLGVLILTISIVGHVVVLLSVRTLHIIIKYVLHLYDMRQEGTTAITPSEENKVWERRGPIAYYIELGFEMTALFMDLIHHLHMLVWSNIFLSMASLVICMQLRYLSQEIQRRYKKHRNYLWVRNHLEQNYPMASSKELSDNSDNCAICWEKMESARTLPCTHLFHNILLVPISYHSESSAMRGKGDNCLVLGPNDMVNSLKLQNQSPRVSGDTCLLSWLEQDTSCPTCRMALNIQNPSASRMDSPDHQADQPQPMRRQLNHFFHFDGSRYVSWLPSFSVEVSHAQLVRQESPASNSQLDAMARQMKLIPIFVILGSTAFPNMPLSVITDDLRVTHSVELTIENVLDGRLVAPPMFREPQAPPAVSRPLGMLQPATNFGNEEVSSRTWDNYNTEPVETDDNLNLGSRFSKSSSEREKILHRRKENMIHNARKRYIEKQKAAIAFHTDEQS
ncbi:hypothetical protein WA026_018198 [Henosepilachna vigintioctopunctata]|uniref:CUE domain-containing protein n=1 Tax=Henosepilachna vigintioctopunctata TaxID=420089 RepID=A0AAW1V9I5_9CUCU